TPPWPTAPILAVPSPGWIGDTAGSVPARRTPGSPFGLRHWDSPQLGRLIVDHCERHLPSAPAGDRRPGRGPAGWPSGMHLRAVAEVEADRLHHPERRALGEPVGGREHAGVLLQP